MLYAILCYDSEAVVGAWTKEQDDEAMTKLAVVTDKLAEEGRLGPMGRLGPTRAAKTLRKGRNAAVHDGPFAETKEHLLGFYVVDCASAEDALAVAKELGGASMTEGGYEIRPLTYFKAGAVEA